MCKAVRQALADAEQGRKDAQLCEVMELEKAVHDAERSYRNIYDWATVRKAKRKLQRWEARCDAAKTALAECLKSKREYL